MGFYSTTLAFKTNGAPAKDIVIDRVYIVAGNVAPEPVTWALMLGGYGLAGKCRGEPA